MTDPDETQPIPGDVTGGGSAGGDGPGGGSVGASRIGSGIGGGSGGASRIGSGIGGGSGSGDGGGGGDGGGDGQTYETASARVEAIIRRLDAGAAGLRETLELVKEGRGLIEFCARELEAVSNGLEELRLEELVERLEVPSGPRVPERRSSTT